MLLNSDNEISMIEPEQPSRRSVATYHDSSVYWTGVSGSHRPLVDRALRAYHECVAGVDAYPTLVAVQAEYLLPKATALYVNVGRIWNARLSNISADI